MSKTIIILIIVATVIAAIAFWGLSDTKKPALNTNSEQNKTQNQETDIVSIGAILQDGNNNISGVTPEQIVDLSSSSESIKEIDMTSFYEMIDEKPRPQYSIKKITVNKGDLLRIKVTVTKGMHDFNIDDYNIHQETPLDQTVTIKLKADKVGEFIYYCSKPGHRQNGHWGVLVVKG